MAQHPQVPPFGSWEMKEDVPYTAYFENARKGKKGEKLNPNDPGENSETESKDKKGSESPRMKHEHGTSQEDSGPSRTTDSQLHSDAMGHKAAADSTSQNAGVRSENTRLELDTAKGPDTRRPRHERRSSREDIDLRRQTDSPLRHEIVGRKSNMESPHHRYGGLSAGDTPKRSSRHSVGSDRSVEHSPLHPHSHARVGVKGSGVSSPSWERKGTSEGSQGLAPSTPGRSRLRSVTRGDDTPDRSPAVPIFGGWDENDPASAEGYTHIFNQVRVEKQSGGAKVPVMPTETSYSNGQKQYGNDNSKICFCFPRRRR